MHPLLYRVRQRLRLPDDLQSLFVGETGLDWSFSPTEQKYYSFRGGVVHSRISGGNLPDPDLLFIKRCDAEGLDRDSEAAKRMKPTTDTVQLWEHWKARG